MEYEVPKLEVIELDEIDVIQTSPIGEGSGSENELPPVVMSLDADY